jgi:hypothetical protein
MPSMAPVSRRNVIMEKKFVVMAFAVLLLSGISFFGEDAPEIKDAAAAPAEENSIDNDDDDSAKNKKKGGNSDAKPDKAKVKNENSPYAYLMPEFGEPTELGLRMTVTPSIEKGKIRLAINEENSPSVQVETIFVEINSKDLDFALKYMQVLFY